MRVIGRIGCGLLVMLWALAPVAAVADDSRLHRIQQAMAEGKVYLEPGTAMGELEVWTRRLESAVARVQMDVPVRVALWTSVPGLPPTDEQFETDATGMRRQLGLDGGIAITNWVSEAKVDSDDIPSDAQRRVRALTEQTDAVAEKLVEAAGDAERYRRLTPVAWTWVWLKLAGQQDPRPRTIVAELAGDLSLLNDGAVPPNLENYYVEEDAGLIHPLTILAAVLTLLATATLFLLRWRRGDARTRDAQLPLRRSRSVIELSDLQLEKEVTELAVAIAGGEVDPDDRAQGRAQAHLDAAASYVDSTLDRERMGCHLLALDGLILLQGRAVPARCFFNPEHYSEASVGKGSVRVPCCLRCAGAVRKGERPEALIVADEDGRVDAYYDTRDMWTKTGYGSLPGNWARRALLASLTKAVGR